MGLRSFADRSSAIIWFPAIVPLHNPVSHVERKLLGPKAGQGGLVRDAFLFGYAVMQHASSMTDLVPCDRVVHRAYLSFTKD